MILEGSIIEWMDVDKSTATAKKDTIGNFIRSYAEYFKRRVNNEYRMIANGINILTRDSDGWTKILKITKYENNDSIRITLKAGDNYITVDKYALIPVYDETYTIGFHGERKYNYVLKNIEKITDNDKIKIIRGTETFFEHPDVFPSTSEALLYEICTKSKFININGFYLYAYDYVEINEIEKWKNSLK